MPIACSCNSSLTCLHQTLVNADPGNYASVSLAIGGSGRSAPSQGQNYRAAHMGLRRLCLGALQKVQHTWQLTGPPTPQLALAGACQAQQPLPSLADAMRDMLGSSLWLAVPKHKVKA